jgi:FkbM family methyltransferase
MLIPFEKLPMGKVTGVIHVGAHEAEELEGYLLSGIRKVTWIEANPAKVELIKDKLKKYRDMNIGSFAAGNKNGVTYLNLANNGQSSSVLELGTHKQQHPQVSFTSRIEVKVQKIDDYIANEGLDRECYNFINLDIQGYELMALRGAVKQLEYIDFVYSEINQDEVYAGCARVEELDDFIGDFGFERILTAMTPHGWGDAFYFKVSG